MWTWSTSNETENIIVGTVKNNVTKTLSILTGFLVSIIFVCLPFLCLQNVHPF